MAAKLTAWRIDIKSLPEAATDSLYKLQNDPNYTVIAEHEVDVCPQVEAILAKKAEGRPVTPEEYYLLTQFVDRVERGLIRQLQEEVRAEEEREREVRAGIPAATFEIPLEKFEVSDRVFAIVSETGLQSVGDLILLMRLDIDSIWRLSGMGPKAMHELEEAITKLVDRLQEEETLKEAERLAAEAAAPELAPEPEAVVIEEVEAPAEVQQEIEPIGVEEVLTKEEEPVGEGIQPEPEAAVGEAVQPEGEAAIEELLAEPEKIEVSEPEQAIGEIEVEEEPSTLDEIFALRPEVFEYEHVGDEDEGEEDEDRKKKKKRKKTVEVEYDPDKDVMVAKKKHKKSDLDWDSEW